MGPNEDIYFQNIAWEYKSHLRKQVVFMAFCVTIWLTATCKDVAPAVPYLLINCQRQLDNLPGNSRADLCQCIPTKEMRL